MKQNTTPKQTAKLIELGVEKPCSIVSVEPIYGMGGISVAKAYSIGELMEMLPGRINGIDLTIDRYYAFEQWHIYYDASQYFTKQTELIDALYDMIIMLKEKGNI